MSMPETTLELEDGAFFFGVGGRYEPIHRVFADCDLSTGVQSVLNMYPVSMRQPVHPVISRQVFVSQLGTEVVVRQSAHERSYGHRLSYSLEVKRISVEPED